MIALGNFPVYINLQFIKQHFKYALHCFQTTLHMHLVALETKQVHFFFLFSLFCALVVEPYKGWMYRASCRKTAANDAYDSCISMLYSTQSYICTPTRVLTGTSTDRALWTCLVNACYACNCSICTKMLITLQTLTNAKQFSINNFPTYCFARDCWIF